jgi:hypothetical protein
MTTACRLRHELLGRQAAGLPNLLEEGRVHLMVHLHLMLTCC